MIPMFPFKVSTLAKSRNQAERRSWACRSSHSAMESFGRCGGLRDQAFEAVSFVQAGA